MITIQAPPSKSISHRALISAALADGVSVINGISECDDVARTASVLYAIGAKIERFGNGIRRVEGIGGHLLKDNANTADKGIISCDVGESGTSFRLLTAVLSAYLGRFRVCGKPRLCERPIGTLLSVLRQMGADIECESLPDHAPFVVNAHGLDGGDIVLSLDESSQYLSGILLAAPYCRSSVRITIGGHSVVSLPYVFLTLETLEFSGISFLVEQYRSGAWHKAEWRTLKQIHPNELRITVYPSVYQPRIYTIEGDWSGASYFLAAGAVGKAPVCVCGLNEHSLQGDRAIIDLLRSMGADVSITNKEIVVFPSDLQGIDVDMSDCPDLVPTVVALSVYAKGKTCIRGVAHIRLKECDRISALAQELRRVGVRVDIKDDGLVIDGLGHAPHTLGIQFEAHNDHRIAMAEALLGLYCEAVKIDHPEAVSKSFPEFWDMWQKYIIAEEREV